MADDKKNKEHVGGSDIWILIPLAALSIPIISILSDTESLILEVAMGAAMILAILGVLTRGLMTHRHRLDIAHMEAQSRLAGEEAKRAAETNALLAKNAEVRQLRQAVRSDALSRSVEAPKKTT